MVDSAARTIASTVSAQAVRRIGQNEIKESLIEFRKDIQKVPMSNLAQSRFSNAFDLPSDEFCLECPLLLLIDPGECFRHITGIANTAIVKVPDNDGSVGNLMAEPIDTSGLPFGRGTSNAPFFRNLRGGRAHALRGIFQCPLLVDTG